MVEVLVRQHETRTVFDLVNLYENGALDLSPAFQRRSVWTLGDRRKLIDTILRNYPTPAVFLYRQTEGGRLRYSVVDGKQRLETILGFLGRIRGVKFDVTVDDVPGIAGRQRISARSLHGSRVHREDIWPRLLGYKLPVVEVEGDLHAVVEVFVRINSAGKPLTVQERRHARYSNSPLLRAATALANRMESRLRRIGVVGDQQISRMKHVELMAELIVSAERGDAINKKSALDRVMNTDSIRAAALKRAVLRVQNAIGRIDRMFPELRTIRLRQLVDFYSLALLVLKLEGEGAILTDRRRNRQAWGLLQAFASEVDDVREAQRRLQRIPEEKELYRDYLLTVSQMTDDVSQRRRREDILRGLIGSIFAKKDERRGFSPEQRRILWGSVTNRFCSICGKPVGWDDLTMDHIRPYSKGGRSELANAALAHRRCNSSAGNRPKSRKSRAAFE